MKVTISSRSIKLTGLTIEHITNKANKLENHLNSEDEVKILIAYDKDIYKVEITILSTDSTIIRSDSLDEDLYFAIDMVLEKICKQLIRHKCKMKFENKTNILFEKEEQDFACKNQEKNIFIEKTKK